MKSKDPNAEQIAYWNGVVGERWAAEQAVMDRALAVWATKLFEAAKLGTGQHVLDVGCGAGTTTLTASSTVGPTGSVVGVDISAPMIERARSQSSGRGNVQFVLADASTEPFDASFDAVISRFGVMFFDDPVAAFRNLRSALKPGGTLTFVCWQPRSENLWATLPFEVVSKIVEPPAPAPPNAPGPFALGDRARLEDVLRSAGFRSLEIDPFVADLILSEQGVDAAVDYATKNGPAGSLLREAADDVKAAARAAMKTALAPHVSPSGRVALKGAVWVVRASA